MLSQLMMHLRVAHGLIDASYVAEVLGANETTVVATSAADGLTNDATVLASNHSAIISTISTTAANVFSTNNRSSIAQQVIKLQPRTDEALRPGLHWPRNFSNPYQIQNSLQRGNLFTTLGGCKFSRWVYNHPIGDEKNLDMVHAIRKKPYAKFLRRQGELQHFARSMDCIYQPWDKWLDSTRNVSQQLQPFDTVYVPLNKVEHFVNVTLVHVKVPIVIISNFFPREINVNQIAEELLSNTFVIRWFLSNIGMNIPQYTHHPKVSPWPYGLPENAIRRRLKKDLQIYFEYFKLATASTTTSSIQNNSNATSPPFHSNKRVNFSLSYLGPTSDARKGIPTTGDRMTVSAYYETLMQTQFVFSPNGDRPDCYRHYEAIGLGTVPITQLDPYLYRHLAEAPVIFNNTIWNVSYWNATTLEEQIVRMKNNDANFSTNPAVGSATGITTSSTSAPAIVNRNMVFEEYWMEYTEREVGRALTWWDHHRNTPTTLESIYQTLLVQF